MTCRSFLAWVVVGAVLICTVYTFFDKQSISTNQKEVRFPPARGKTNVNANYCINHTFQSVYSYNTKWEVNTDVCNGCFNFVKTRLKTRFGNTPIHVYESEEDLFVSSSIIKTGSFDAAKINRLLNYFILDPTLNFIDIGANLGVFSLSVAKLGRRVLAIEALNKNVQHVCLSIRDGGLQNNIKILHNALSDQSGMEVNLGVDVNNMGGTFVDFEAENTKKIKTEYKLKIGGTYGSVLTITLDDLLELEEIKDFKNVIIKIDIEGFEYKALLGGHAFFDLVNVKAVFMEWVFHRNKRSGNGIIEFMTKRNFRPYTENGVQELDVLKPESWKDLNVLWLK